MFIKLFGSRNCAPVTLFFSIKREIIYSDIHIDEGVWGDMLLSDSCTFLRDQTFFSAFCLHKPRVEVKIDYSEHYGVTCGKDGLIGYEKLKNRAGKRVTSTWIWVRLSVALFTFLHIFFWAKEQRNYQLLSQIQYQEFIWYYISLWIFQRLEQLVIPRVQRENAQRLARRTDMRRSLQDRTMRCEISPFYEFKTELRRALIPTHCTVADNLMHSFLPLPSLITLRIPL